MRIACDLLHSLYTVLHGHGEFKSIAIWELNVWIENCYANEYKN